MNTLRQIGCLVLLVAASAASAHAHLVDADSQSTQPKRPWTVLIYAAVDNSADMPLIAFVNHVRRAIDDDPGIELLLFIDRSQKHPKRKTFLGDDFTTTRLYRVRKNSAERLSSGQQFSEITPTTDSKLNSADAANVGRFIAWGKEKFPADRYALMIYSHANCRTMCPVERTGDYMGIPELSEKVSREQRVDFLALELCNMGGIEIAYQWRPGNGGFEADVLLAIPNAGPPLDWHRAFARIRSPSHEAKKGPPVDPAAMTAADFGRLVIEEGYRGRQASGQRMAHESAGCYDLHQVDAVKRAVDALSVQLAQAKAKEIVLELRGAGSDNGAICYNRDGSNVDLYDLCRRISVCDRLPEPVHVAARNAMEAIQRFMIGSFGMKAYKGFEPGNNGAYIVLPSGKPGCWKEFRWYTPLAGAGKTGGWSFLRDGATPNNGVVENWFELLDSWFKEPDDQGGASEPATRTLIGRYAKGANVIRIEPFDDKLLALPLWWGGMQPLDRRAGAVFEMQNRREAVFTFTTGSLTVTGHRELDGTYHKLGSELAPMESLLAGEKNSAYRGFGHWASRKKQLFEW